MQNKKSLVHGMSVFLGLIVIAIGIVASAQSDEVFSSRLDQCQEQVLEVLDREQTFKDVPLQQWYTHAINFGYLLQLLDDTRPTPELATVDRFYPAKKITERQFGDLLKRFAPLFDEERDAFYVSLTRGKRTYLKKEKAVALAADAFGISADELRAELEQKGIRHNILLHREAAYLLYAAAQHVFEESPEVRLCTEWEKINPDTFTEAFGGEEDIDPSTPISPERTITLPATPIISAEKSVMNFAPVNPRAGQTVTVKITARDTAGESVQGAKFNLIVTGGRDYKKEYPLTETSAGIYEYEFFSQWAGTYAISLKGAHGLSLSRTLTFRPGQPLSVDVRVQVPQIESTSKKEVVLAATLRDEFKNIIKPAKASDYRVTTDRGLVTKVEESGGEVRITLEAGDYGEAKIDVRHLTRSVEDAAARIVVPFTPIMFAVPKGAEPDTVIEVPLYLYIPKEKGKIGAYTVTLQYEKEDLIFSTVKDLNTSDGFKVPNIEKRDSALVLSQSTMTMPADNVVPVGSLHFLATSSVGSGTIYIPEIKIINDQEKIITMPDPSGWIDGWSRWWYDIKPGKEVCLDVWVFENGGSRQDVLNDVQQASNIFNKAADASYCPFFINWTTNFHNVSATDFAAKVDAAGGTALALDDFEEANLRGNYHGDPACVQVWYVPHIAPGPDGKSALGLSYSNNGGIAIDNSGDYDGRTLAHELAHQLSGNDVLDSPDDAGNTQGARDNGNPMNYDDPGDNFTKAQCELIQQPPYIK